jgi:MFS family permease
VSTLARRFPALRHPSFRLYLAGQVVSLVGTWLQSVAQSWLVYRLTGSPLLLGLAGFLGQGPVFFLAPLGGVWADRTERRRLLIATQSASGILAALLGVLTLTGHITIGTLLAVAAALGVVNAFDIPARQSFVVEMVGKSDLPNAIALNSIGVNSARILGPALAGVLVAAIGEGWCFLLNAVSFTAVVLALSLVRVETQQLPASKGSARSDLTAAWRFIAATPPVRALLLLLGIVSAMGMPYTVLMPLFADRILGSGSQGLGLMLGASGVGALSAALLLAVRTSPRGLGRWVAVAATGFGATLILFSASRWLALSAVLLVVVGFFMMMQMAASNTLLQVLTPDSLRGRVMAAYSMMFMGMAPFGALGAGVAAGRLGAPLAVALGGGVALLGGLVFAWRLPSLRGPARTLVIAYEHVGGEPPEGAAPTAPRPGSSEPATRQLQSISNAR